jgi:8-oxo-dGTP pyrophosphatase MutT (NUDIX family)
MHKEEAPKMGLAREIKEELGIDVEVGRPISAHYVVHTKTGIPQLVLVYECKDAPGEMTIDGNELEEIRWATPEELKNLPMFGDCHAAVEEFFSQK